MLASLFQSRLRAGPGGALLGAMVRALQADGRGAVSVGIRGTNFLAVPSGALPCRQMQKQPQQLIK